MTAPFAQGEPWALPRQLDKLEFDGEIFMKSFENIIPSDFQGGVLVLKDGQVVFDE